MKAKYLSMILSLSLLTSTTGNAGELTFRYSYEKPFYTKSSFVYGTVAVATVGAAVFTTVTAGTGAPAAAAGVSSLASLIGGGGAGSYMAGLSTIGGIIGGNAITGAALLNGLSVAVLGGGVKSMGAVALKTLAAGEMGAFLFKEVQDAKNQDIGYTINIPYSKRLGSSDIQNLIDDFEKNSEAYKDKKLSEKEYANTLASLKNKITHVVQTSTNQEDIINGSILLFKFGEMDLFTKSILSLKNDDSEKQSLLYYLKGIAFLINKDYQKAEDAINSSIASENKIIESLMVLSIILERSGRLDRLKGVIDKFDEFDKDYYKTPNSLTSAYDLVGTIYQSGGYFDDAISYYEKAYDEMGWLGNDDKKAVLLSKKAYVYNMLGKNEVSDSLYKKALDKASTEEVRKLISETYKNLDKV